MYQETFNRTALVGRVLHKPIIKKTRSGVSVTTFYVTTTRVWEHRGELRTESTAHACVAWDSIADMVGMKLDKGDLVYVGGRLQTKTFEQNDGTENEISEIVVSQLRPLLKKNEDLLDAEQIINKIKGEYRRWEKRVVNLIRSSKA